MSRFTEMWDKVLKEKLVAKTNIGNTGFSQKAPSEVTEETDDKEVIFTKHELFMAQAPSWNFELDEEQLLDKALELGFVTKIGDDQYLMNNNYVPLKAREDLDEAFVLCYEDLKYEGKFKVGDTIKAFDFKPSEGRPDRYMVGTITDTAEREGAKVYVIKVTDDSGNELGGRVGKIGYVPMEVAYDDFDGRIIMQSMYEGEVGDSVKLSPKVKHDAYGFASVHHDGKFYLIFNDEVVGKYDKYEDFKDAHENAINKMELPEGKYKSDAQRKAIHASKAEKLKEFGPDERYLKIGNNTMIANKKTGSVSSTLSLGGDKTATVNNHLNKDGSSGKLRVSGTLGDVKFKASNNINGNEPKASATHKGVTTNLNASEKLKVRESGSPLKGDDDDDLSDLLRIAGLK